LFEKLSAEKEFHEVDTWTRAQRNMWLIFSPFSSRRITVW
jgi:hypothetical protein